jgi:hypothetical protein
MTLATLFLLSPVMLQAQEKKDVEVLPLPQPLILQAPHMQIVLPRPRYESREVWNNYRVDGMGFFQHRVIQAPEGAYYYQNGMPYRWVTNNPRIWMSYATD